MYFVCLRAETFSNLKTIYLKLLEEKDKNWSLLLDSWYEFHSFCPPGSAIEAYQTSEGKDYLRGLLHAFVQNIDSPIVIAWDSIRKQVGELNGLRSAQDILNLRYCD